MGHEAHCCSRNATLFRKAHIFRDRADLIAYEEVWSLETAISECQTFESGIEVYKEARSQFEAALSDKDLDNHVRSLPFFLRKFTKGSILAYVLNNSVELLEKNRRYDDAVKLLQYLLRQDLYLRDYHGHWHERLALDLDQHLKRPGDSLQSIEDGMDNSNVQVARKLALCLRAEKICSAKKNEKEAQFKDNLKRLSRRDDWIDPVSECPKVTIQGRRMFDDTSGKSLWNYQVGDEHACSSVEEYVQHWFMENEGFTEGRHAEGSVVNTIYAILFWRVFYEVKVEDAFRGPNQALSLDHNTSDFYKNRKSEIDSR